MVTFTHTIVNSTGLHARPAALLAKLCQRYQCEIVLNSGSRALQGKSVVSILSGGLKKGTQLTVSASGPDEAEAAQALFTKACPETEVSLLSGGQPVYYYTISIE